MQTDWSNHGQENVLGDVARKTNGSKCTVANRTSA